MRAGEAVMKLVSMGYHFELIKSKVRYKWQGPGDPDQAAASHLLALVRQHKEDVAFFLKCHCPRCGGCCFVPDGAGQALCLKCDWPTLAKFHSGMAEVKH